MNPCEDPAAACCPCVVCGASVHTCDGPCPGVQLRNGAWTCSEACWDKAAGDPSGPTLRLGKAAFSGVADDVVQALQDVFGPGRIEIVPEPITDADRATKTLRFVLKSRPIALTHTIDISVDDAVGEG